MVSAMLDKAHPSRMSGKNRRQQIVVVAAELFARKGFSGTTTKEIAEGAGVSEAIIFRHFASKDKLYAAILDYKVKQGSERMKAQLLEAAGRKDDRAFFGSLAFEMLEFHSKDRTFMRLLLFSALEGHDLSNIFFDSTARDMKNHIRKYIKQRIADGAFRSIDPAVAARAFVGMVLHQVQARIIFNEDDVRLSNRQLSDRFVEIFLNGVQDLEPGKNTGNRR
ncbi:MAG TPA: TetR/AcrR family transcriptional regulator [Blastocatellia bacterium]|nr:TetR/AcrR family transcriptional regulator [Blastocatellia bacterium]